MDIARSARISWHARLDKTYPKGIHVGDESYCASGCLILTHDFARNIHTHTRIGKRCFIGADAIILPGTMIGDSVVVGAGAVVTKNVPSGCVVAGNPAKIVRSGIRTACFGRIEDLNMLNSTETKTGTAGRVRIRRAIHSHDRSRAQGDYNNGSVGTGRSGRNVVNTARQ